MFVSIYRLCVSVCDGICSDKDGGRDGARELASEMGREREREKEKGGGEIKCGRRRQMETNAPNIEQGVGWVRCGAAKKVGWGGVGRGAGLAREAEGKRSRVRVWTRPREPLCVQGQWRPLRAGSFLRREESPQSVMLSVMSAPAAPTSHSI